MRIVKQATCTDVEPVSPGRTPNFSIPSCFSACLRSGASALSMFKARSTGSGTDCSRLAGVRYLYKGVAMEEKESDGAAEEESGRQVGEAGGGRDEGEDRRTE